MSLSEWQLQLAQFLVRILDTVECNAHCHHDVAATALALCYFADKAWISRFPNSSGRRYIHVLSTSCLKEKDIEESSRTSFRAIATFGCVFGIGSYNILPHEKRETQIEITGTSTNMDYYFGAPAFGEDEDDPCPAFRLLRILRANDSSPPGWALQSFRFFCPLPVSAPSVCIGKDKELILIREIDEATEEILHRDLLPIVLDYLRFPRECVFGAPKELARYAFDVIDLSDAAVPDPEDTERNEDSEKESSVSMPYTHEDHPVEFQKVLKFKSWLSS
jgi:hypothetical protein